MKAKILFISVLFIFITSCVNSDELLAPKIDEFKLAGI